MKRTLTLLAISIASPVFALPNQTPSVKQQLKQAAPGKKSLYQAANYAGSWQGNCKNTGSYKFKVTQTEDSLIINNYSEELEDRLEIYPFDQTNTLTMHTDFGSFYRTDRSAVVANANGDVTLLKVENSNGLSHFYLHTYAEHLKLVNDSLHYLAFNVVTDSKGGKPLSYETECVFNRVK